MNRIKRCLRHLLTVAALATTFSAVNDGSAQAQDKPALAGTWVATLSYAGETQSVALTFEPSAGGDFLVKLSSPAVHVWDVPIGKAKVEGGKVRIGQAIVFDYDPVAGTISGAMPKAFVPVHTIPAIFRRAKLEHPPRPQPTAPVVEPAWVFDAGAPVWADATYADGVVYVGADDGRLHALEARTGKERWVFRAGGPIRARVTPAAGELFVQADDGFLYKIDAAKGTERFKVRVNLKPIERLPPSHEKSRFDRSASAATVANGRIILGTHDGHVLCLDAKDGKRLWDFAAGDSVLSTPVVDAGRVAFGSFDGNVYAVDAASGALAWKHDTGAPVVSTPALHEGRVIVGSRSYDLVALDGTTGVPAWTRYIWFSWVESPVAVLGGTAYVGSSDAARLYAFDARTGRSVWDVDVHGWAWGQPAVTDKRVFIGTSATPNYLVGHDSAFVAVDRMTGQMARRFPVAKPKDDSTYGFAASPAVGEGLVFAGAVDGKVYAFAQ